MLKGVFILSKEAAELVYGPDERKSIGRFVDMVPGVYTGESIRQDLPALKDIEVIFSGWGGPRMDGEFLESAPKLKIVFYGAGSVKGIVTDAFWDRGILITSAYAANGVPVAEYTLSQILFSLKCGWHYVTGIKAKKSYRLEKVDAPGGYGSTVGIISLGTIGRMVCKLLKNFDLQVIAYDPYAEEEEALELGVKLCSLDELFQKADVVSLHSPLLKETESMIRGCHFKMMKPHATFINTARGAVVNEAEMVQVLKERRDLFAVLDVTCPEPPPPGSPLYTLPNVILTPHIAGSMGKECRRMGRYMVEELERYVGGEPLRWQITREKLATMA